jgi:Transposase domain (DUF772)
MPADIIVAVIVLQALHGLSDAEAMQAVTFDLRWKAALGLPVAATGSHPTTRQGFDASRSPPGKTTTRLPSASAVCATSRLAGRAPTVSSSRPSRSVHAS